MAEDLISVIVPCYNAEKTIAKCLMSISAQTYENIEIIVVNDGSTDRTNAVLADLGAQDARIKVYHLENGGVSKARNAGLAAATGKFLTFVDSDDWINSTYCSSLYQLIISGDADIAIIEASYEDEQGNVVFQQPLSEENSFHGKRALSLLLEDRVIQSHPWGKLYRAYLLENITFPEDLKCFEDYSTLFRIFDKAAKVVRSNEKLYHYIQHADSLSHNLSPETAYQFYLAVMRVLTFWTNTEQTDNRKLITRNIIRKLLMILKRILRNTSKEEMQIEKENIRKSFGHFLKRPVSEIGLEYYFYVRLYYYFPAVYTRLISKK